MEIVVYSKKYVSTKVSKEIVPFQQEFPILECHVKNDPIGHPESEKNIIVVRNPTPPENLRLLMTPTPAPQPWFTHEISYAISC